MAPHTPTNKKSAELSTAKKRAFLEKRLQRRQTKETQTITIPRRTRPTPAPLTYAQEGVWYAEQLQPEIATYNMPFAWRLRGPLDISALERSLNTIAQRHEALRTHFEVVTDRPAQVITPDLSLTLQITDLQSLPETKRETQALALIDQEIHRPFDLTQAPLLRVTLLQLGLDDYYLILNLHHIISDGWSVSLLNHELASLYNAFVAAQATPDLPELPIQYADFAIWQRQQVANGALESHLAYWRAQLAGAPPLLELPADYPRPTSPSYRGDKLEITLPASLSQALKSLSRETRTTLFTTLLAAFKLLLQRYTGQEDIVIGTPMANRNHTEIEALIGYFLNNLVLRTKLSGNPSFRELLDRVRATTLDAYKHQNVPFEQLAQTLQPERERSYTPFFQVFFNMYTYDLAKLDLTGLVAESLAPDGLEPGSKFDLTLYAREDKQTIRLILAYSTDLFRRERMVELLAQYEHLLGQIVAAPDQPIAAYSLVTPTAQRLLPDPRDTLDEPPHELVTAMVSRWADQTPEQAAISQGDRVWSYRELIEQSQGLAQTLRAGGLKQGDAVAIYAPRSFGLIASMLGVFISGAVLLLIDPLLPPQRKQLMLHQAKAKRLIWVKDESFSDPWGEMETNLPCLYVEAETGCLVDPIYKDVADVSLPELSPDDPAYIFFTSGTTGTPKGVLGCHKGLSHFLKWQGETFAIQPYDRAAQLTGLSFDVVLRDILLALTQGATLCLPETAIGLSPGEVIPWLEQTRISILHTVPTLAQAWLADIVKDVTLPHLRRAFFAGEPLTGILAQQWRNIFPNCEIINLYGPTETTLAKCYYRVPGNPAPGAQPVGRPLPQTQALVLADGQRLCGIGEPGEIALRTPFRSLGYINVHHDTGFVQNPFRDNAQDKLYYTGDRGRYQPDGALEILGRMDDQVKIRGARIEPGEVTTILTQHPAVKAGVVVAHKDEQGQTYLAAYVVAQTPEVTSSTLRSYLSQRLPPAMVPAAFVALDRLPLTANGKIDRRQLPPPHLTDFDHQADFIAPRDEIETIITEIWQEVLAIEQIGIHHNFFHLGGHSLHAIQVIARLKRDYDIDIPLRHLFEYPTIAELAKVVEVIFVETLV